MQQGLQPAIYDDSKIYHPPKVTTFNHPVHYNDRSREDKPNLGDGIICCAFLMICVTIVLAIYAFAVKEDYDHQPIIIAFIVFASVLSCWCCLVMIPLYFHLVGCCYTVISNSISHDNCTSSLESKSKVEERNDTDQAELSC